MTTSTADRTAEEPVAAASPAETVAALRAAFDAGTIRSRSHRRSQLEALDHMLIQHAEEFTAALEADLGKPAVESRITEIAVLTGEIEGMLKNLDHWTASKQVSVPMVLQPARARIDVQPLGVVLVIAPWNYPLQLSLAPAIGAIAAGNAVVIKPSEIAPATSAAMARLIPRYLDPRSVRVVEGGVDVTTDLLEQRFDHIFYTGNGTVGRVVMRAAAEHLTPVTLELGGKSPTWVDDTTDLAVAARRIAWGRFINAGQTCVAPDYVLTTPDVADTLITHLSDAIATFYGPDAAASPSFGKIVSDKHFERLTRLLTGDIVIGGEHDAARRSIAPTVIRADADHPAMQEEIFGPILPIITVADAHEAVAFVNARPRPLALYVFSEDPWVRDVFTDQTTSGAIGFNVPIAHLTVPGLPFGGVGDSGMGNYHGRHSITTFSHRRAVLTKPLHPDTMQVTYPPYSSGFKNLVIDRLLAPLRERHPWAGRSGQGPSTFSR